MPLILRTAEPPPRPRWQSLRRGFRMRCPGCGVGRLYRSYVKTHDRCPHCGEELFHHRADDAPAYFTILIVGHLVVTGVLSAERALTPPIWVQMAVWVPMILVLSLSLLPRIKGMLVGLQWALYMHGFGGGDGDPAEPA